MTFRSSQLAPAVTLAIGLLLGWGLSGSHATRLQAAGADRSGESILTAGPIALRYYEGTKIQVAQDALYYLDYKAGRLLATVPSMKQLVGSTKMIDVFAERDLVADFKIDLDHGPRPHFLMTTGSLGSYGDGWAPLYVFETSSQQVGVYRIVPQIVGTTSKPKFELMELRAFRSALGTAAQ